MSHEHNFQLNDNDTKATSQALHATDGSIHMPVVPWLILE